MTARCYKMHTSYACICLPMQPISTHCVHAVSHSYTPIMAPAHLSDASPDALHFKHAGTHKGGSGKQATGMP